MQVGVGCLTAMGAITRVVYGAAATSWALRDTMVSLTRYATIVVSAVYGTAFPKSQISTCLRCEGGGTYTRGGRESGCTLGSWWPMLRSSDVWVLDGVVAKGV